MLHQQQALAEVALVTTLKPMAHRDTYWNAIVSIGKRGPFKMRDVSDACHPEARHDAMLGKYLRGLVNAGILGTDGVRPVPTYWLASVPQHVPHVKPDGNLYVGQFSVVIPRGEAGAWMLARKLGKGRREFTAEAIVEQSRGAVDAGDLADYLARLMKGGFVEMTGVTVLKGGAVTRAYRLLKVQPETPRLSRDGVPLASPQRFACLWRAMKMLGYFTTLDLASSASLPELPITEEQAARYATDLAHAGYLQMKERAGQPPLYRLKQTMNTGPCAPEVLRARFVWDPNTCRVVGDAARIEEVRP